MLRWVARVLRIGLMGIGLVGLLWMPVSYYFWAHVPTPVEGLQADFTHGSMTLSWPHGPWRSRPEWYPSIYPALSHLVSDSFAHTLIDVDKSGWQAYATTGNFVQIRGTLIEFPLWIFSLICLAWPVTSFIIARRRHKRGFPVEPTEASDSEAPNVRSNEAQGASPG